MQEIHLDKHIRLLDSPGIVFASGEGAAAAALRNAIKVSLGRQLSETRAITAAAHFPSYAQLPSDHVFLPSVSPGCNSLFKMLFALLLCNRWSG